jgi:hypothetical protein
MKKPTETDSSERVLQALERVRQRVNVLERDMDVLAKQVAKLNANVPPAGSQQPRGPVIEQQGYLAGQWHKRDGTVYGRVALPGSPNADNQTGAVQPPERSRD